MCVCVCFGDQLTSDIQLLFQMRPSFSESGMHAAALGVGTEFTGHGWHVDV